MSDVENKDLELVLSAKAEETPLDNFDPEIVKEVEETETPPSPYSEEWHDYAMRQFRDDELEGGNPIHAGLIRVTELLIGPIYSRKVVSHIGPSDSNRGTATVAMRIKVKVTNPQHAFVGELISEDGVGDVNNRNTPAPFHMHPSASAKTKAEAQALRNILRLRRVVSADEVAPEGSNDNDLFSPDSLITDEHINVLDLVCKRTNISVLDYINCGRAKYGVVEQIPSSAAINMIKFLNKIQSGQEKRPENVGKYEADWREKNEGKK